MFNRIMFALALLGLASFSCLATDDAITTTVTSLSGYWTAIQTVAIGIVLFVLGRKLLRKV